MEVQLWAIPAIYRDEISTVGAIYNNGNRWTLSAFQSPITGLGGLLDFVGPGVGILSTVPPNTTALDNGTSMASPHAAGIAALMLSVDPYLSGDEVRTIMESTCQKVGNNVTYTNTATRPNGTYVEQVGYGLVYASKAVNLASAARSEVLTCIQKTTLQM